jgi:hypothetical protein
MSENASTEDFGTVNLGRTAVGQLNAGTANLERSAVQRLSADQVYAQNSAVGVSNASTIEVRESAVGVAAGDYIRIEDSRVLLLLAPRVNGNVKAVLTVPSAFALGAGIVVGRQLVRALLSRNDA